MKIMLVTPQIRSIEESSSKTIDIGANQMRFTNLVYDRLSGNIQKLIININHFYK